MFKKILLSLVVISIVACSEKGGSTVKTPSGYEYSHVKMGSQNANPGDYAYFTLKVVGSDGKTLQEMKEGPGMPIMQLPTPDKPTPQANPVLEMLAKGAVGDTMTLIMPIDSIPNAAGNPQLAGMTSISYVAVVKDFKDEVSYKADMEAKRLEMEAKAEESKARIPELEKSVAATLKDYKSGKLKTQETEDGLKYFIHEQGTGAKAEKGMKVSVDYYGITTDGKMFDNSFKRGAPYTFGLGQGSVIRGWDLGIPLLNEGGKATLFIPYELGYGEAGSPPNIGPKAELVFYVELVEAK